jgi:hypothetical protein
MSKIKNMITIDELVQKYRGKRIVIVGNGPYSTTHDFSNYAEKCGEPASIWTVNGGQELHKSSELEFRMDDLLLCEKVNKEKMNKEQFEIYIHKLKNPSVPVFVSCLYPGFDNCIEYPLKYILSTLLKVRPCRSYFAQTIAYAVLFAIFCGVKQIDFYGVDYIEGDRPEQRPCVEYWCGVANGLGIATTAHEKSNFLRTVSSEIFENFELYKLVENYYGYTKDTLEKALKKAG